MLADKNAPNEEVWKQVITCITFGARNVRLTANFLFHFCVGILKLTTLFYVIC